MQGRVKTISKVLFAPLTVTCVLLVKVYQILLSPWLPNACRYTPTCSQYAILALRKHGFLFGGILTIRRIVSCNPWGNHGYDPVP